MQPLEGKNNVFIYKCYILRPFPLLLLVGCRVAILSCLLPFSLLSLSQELHKSAIANAVSSGNLLVNYFSHALLNLLRGYRLLQLMNMLRVLIIYTYYKIYV